MKWKQEEYNSNRFSHKIHHVKFSRLPKEWVVGLKPGTVPTKIEKWKLLENALHAIQSTLENLIQIGSANSQLNANISIKNTLQKECVLLVTKKQKSSLQIVSILIGVLSETRSVVAVACNKVCSNLQPNACILPK